MPLWNINMPSNADLFYNFIMKIASFDILPMEQFWNWAFPGMKKNSCDKQKLCRNRFLENVPSLQFWNYDADLHSIPNPLAICGYLEALHQKQQSGCDLPQDHSKNLLELHDIDNNLILHGCSHVCSNKHLVCKYFAFYLFS